MLLTTVGFPCCIKHNFFSYLTAEKFFMKSACSGAVAVLNKSMAVQSFLNFRLKSRSKTEEEALEQTDDYVQA